ncbi:hypothetical protein ROZALSC1DRAFT_28481 [Rozella allomycis CSF55]|uniref:EF-Hand 1, calcium-binding site domain-containing protein n=1 Tax=Rozella allomycis (strain CSF55) TaxID=988480 RepID=A0A075AWU3_ROZAC|nr:EF-Hand 1, calcium-binding site domain-containing protein [Rozella allomycis CSF55]RKP19983.1 hypothetical protein ROZALSC1DRAFT_28481 [Rozella allomycis CSF55]|eukprot:EPZ33172.1 EF-Hand 1, calcium-binding site domain-containing protein [Rozella allomycis CSF55]
MASSPDQDNIAQVEQNILQVSAAALLQEETVSSSLSSSNDIPLSPVTPAQNQENKAFDWGDQQYETTEKKKNILSRYLSCLPPWLRTIIYIVIGSGLIVFPSILVYVFVPFTTYSLFVYREPQDTNPYMEFLRWSIYLAIIYASFIFSRFFTKRLPVFALWMVQVSQVSVTETVKTRLEYIVALQIYISRFLWTIVIFVATSVFFTYTATSVTPQTAPYHWFLIKFAIVFLVWSGLILFEKLILQVIAVQFHKVAYSDRIKVNNYNSVVLDKLNKAVLSHAKHKAKKANHSSSHDHVDKKKNLKDRLGSKIQNVTEIAGISNLLQSTRYAFTATANAVVGKEKVELNSTTEARKLARKIFESICPTGKDSITVEDFYPYFRTEEEAKEAFLLFDKDENGDISKQEMALETVAIYQERKRLARSMQDLGHCVGKLDNILLFIVFFIMVVVTFPIFEVNITAVLASFGTLLLGLTFVFGGTARNIFENIIFLFVIHPYDVGDRVHIEGQTMVVKEIGMMLTSFQLGDGQIVYIPHTKLVSVNIQNYRRSGNMSESVELFVSSSITAEKIAAIKQLCIKYLENSGRDIPEKISVSGFDIVDPTRIRIVLSVVHKFNFQDMGSKNERKEKFMTYLRKGLLDLGILYDAPPTNISCKLIKD